MKSKTSFFNWGISKNLLKRCWPLWAAYLIVLIIALPVSFGDMRYSKIEVMERSILNSGIAVVYISMFFGVIAAMVMFSFMYTAKGSGMMSSLPLRRETVFTTAWLTGLVPMLICDVLVLLLTVLINLNHAIPSADIWLQWLALAVMGNIAFYGFASFCAVLTGNIIVLPLVYGVLNFTVVVAESCLRALLSTFIYGFLGDGVKLAFLSPAYMMLAGGLQLVANYPGGDAAVFVGAPHEAVSAITPSTEYSVAGMGLLAIYCAVGLLLSAAAVLIYRRRHMETAGDTVAIAKLKPVFKYCLSVGTGLVFAVILREAFYGSVYGIKAAVPTALLLLVGAFIGYFAAEMLMRKTVRVFKGHWRGYIIVAAAFLLFSITVEFDVFGAERYVPKLENIVSVEVTEASAEYYDRENIAAITDFNRRLIANKSENEGARNGRFCYISYHLENGRVFRRSYRIAFNDETINDTDSDLRTWESICNLQEAIDDRTEFALRPDNIDYFYIEYVDPDTGESKRIMKESFTDEQIYELFTDYLMPDIKDGNLARHYICDSEDYFNEVYGVRFFCQIETERKYDEEYGQYYEISDTISLRAATYSERTLQWLEENTDIPLMTKGEQLEKFDSY